VRDVETPRPGESWITILDSKSLVAEISPPRSTAIPTKPALGIKSCYACGLEIPSAYPKALNNTPRKEAQDRGFSCGEHILLFPACRAEKGPTFDPPRLPSEDG